MRILLYSLNFDPEPVGIGKYSGELAYWLAKRNHAVRVITAPPYFPFWSVFDGHLNSFSYELRNAVSIQRCPLWIPRRPSGLSRLLHLASFALSSLCPLLKQYRWKPDVVITVAPAFFCAPGALLLSCFCRSRTITWLHIQDFELDAAFELGLLRGRLLRSFAETVERQIFRGFIRVSSISKAMVQRLRVKGVSPKCSVLLPNWVDLNEIRPQCLQDRIENSYRRELGIGPDQLVLMYSGSMNKKQGLDLLAKVVHELVDYRNLVWVFAGDGPSKKELIHATQGFSQVIHLPLQPSERMNDWLNAADIHLLPQKAGAVDLVLPSKLLGILASGRPVVATSTPNSELAMLVSEAGFCTSPGDVNDFVHAVRLLILDPDLRQKAGRRARNLAEEYFSKEVVLTRFEQDLKSLVASI